jgi:hypothetical protein
MRGEISVYQEHLFTETLQSVLREAISSVDASVAGHDQRPRVLLGGWRCGEHASSFSAARRSVVAQSRRCLCAVGGLASAAPQLIYQLTHGQAWLFEVVVMGVSDKLRVCTNFTPTKRAQWIKEKLGVE